MSKMLSRKEIREICAEKNIKPSKRLGQSFLVCEYALKKITNAAELKKTDFVIEVGAGLGALTHVLAENTKKVISIEKDKRLAQFVKQRFKEFPNVKIIQNDILEIEIPNIVGSEEYKLVANLPFSIATAVIRKFLEVKNPADTIVVLIQKEVAQKICAKPPKTNLLAISVQFYAEPKIISNISKNCFWPQPKVDSAILKIIPQKAKYGEINAKLFFKILKTGFAHPRKQLANTLYLGLKLEKREIENWTLKNKIKPQQRPETLEIMDWVNLTKTFPK